jgi:hypothetical protein
MLRVMADSLMRAVALTLLLLLATGCGEASPGGDPKTALVNAVEQTLAAESFHIESVLTYDGADHRGEINYVAPDRFYMRGFGEGAAISISIGKDYYSSAFEDLDRFTLSRSSCVYTIRDFVPAIAAVLHAEDVQFDDGTYTFTIDGEGDHEGEARIDNGYLSSLSFRYTLPHSGDRVEEQDILSRYGDDDISIEPPPPGQVRPETGPEDFPDVIVVNEGSPPPCP